MKKICRYCGHALKRPLQHELNAIGYFCLLKDNTQVEEEGSCIKFDPQEWLSFPSMN